MKHLGMLPIGPDKGNVDTVSQITDRPPAPAAMHVRKEHPMQTYTVYDPATGTVVGRGLTAAQAMSAILYHHGWLYAIAPRRDERGTLCWRLLFGPNRPDGLRETQIVSLAADEDAARQDMAQQVIAQRWVNYPVAVPDEVYQQRFMVPVTGRPALLPE